MKKGWERDMPTVQMLRSLAQKVNSIATEMSVPHKFCQRSPTQLWTSVMPPLLSGWRLSAAVADAAPISCMPCHGVNRMSAPTNAHGPQVDPNRPDGGLGVSGVS